MPPRSYDVSFPTNHVDDSSKTWNPSNQHAMPLAARKTRRRHRRLWTRTCKGHGIWGDSILVRKYLNGFISRPMACSTDYIPPFRVGFRELRVSSYVLTARYLDQALNLQRISLRGRIPFLSDGLLYKTLGCFRKHALLVAFLGKHALRKFVFLIACIFSCRSRRPPAEKRVQRI